MNVNKKVVAEVNGHPVQVLVLHTKSPIVLLTPYALAKIGHPGQELQMSVVVPTYNAKLVACFICGADYLRAEGRAASTLCSKIDACS